jgi:hypothetical protein
MATQCRCRRTEFDCSRKTTATEIRWHLSLFEPLKDNDSAEVLITEVRMRVASNFCYLGQRNFVLFWRRLVLGLLLIKANNSIFFCAKFQEIGAA